MKRFRVVEVYPIKRQKQLKRRQSIIGSFSFSAKMLTQKIPVIYFDVIGAVFWGPNLCKIMGLIVTKMILSRP